MWLDGDLGSDHHEAPGRRQTYASADLSPRSDLSAPLSGISMNSNSSLRRLLKSARHTTHTTPGAALVDRG